MQQENIPLVDIAALVYQEAPRLTGDAPNHDVPNPAPSSNQTVLVVEPPSLGPVGLLVDGTPAIKRAKQSAFSPVPSVYLIMNRLQGINTLVTVGDQEPPHFLLEVDTVLAKFVQA